MMRLLLSSTILALTPDMEPFLDGGGQHGGVVFHAEANEGGDGVVARGVSGRRRLSGSSHREWLRVHRML